MKTKTIYAAIEVPEDFIDSNIYDISIPTSQGYAHFRILPEPQPVSDVDLFAVPVHWLGRTMTLDEVIAFQYGVEQATTLLTESRPTEPQPVAQTRKYENGKWSEWRDVATDSVAAFIQRRINDGELIELRAYVPATESHPTETQPVAWIYRYPDGELEPGMVIADVDIEDVRKQSGAWAPLYASPTESRPQGDAQIKQTLDEAKEIIS